MSIETQSTHITPAGDNVFADLGFEPAEAAALQARSQRIVSEKLAIKENLMNEISGWIAQKHLKQAEAAGRKTGSENGVSSNIPTFP